MSSPLPESVYAAGSCNGTSTSSSFITRGVFSSSPLPLGVQLSVTDVVVMLEVVARVSRGDLGRISGGGRRGVPAALSSPTEPRVTRRIGVVWFDERTGRCFPGVDIAAPTPRGRVVAVAAEDVPGRVVEEFVRAIAAPLLVPAAVPGRRVRVM